MFGARASRSRGEKERAPARSVRPHRALADVHSQLTAPFYKKAQSQSVRFFLELFKSFFIYPPLESIGYILMNLLI